MPKSLFFDCLIKIVGNFVNPIFDCWVSLNHRNLGIYFNQLYWSDFIRVIIIIIVVVIDRESFSCLNYSGESNHFN